MVITTMSSRADLVEKLQVEVKTRGHKVIIDEPTRLGGTDEGMNPLELLLSSLGACQTIVAQMSAKKLGVQYHHLTVELEGDIDTDGFLGLSDIRPGFLEIRYKVNIISDERQKKIEEFISYVEAHCPALDSLINGVKVVSQGVNVQQTEK
ncbi:OsmC family protein [Psychrobacillus sp. FSL K6-2684]|uniref:OsmC family protein n=1 Tax=unclassified Psychrobacillus TaxID=2636677 RepID=UPI0030F5024E